MLNNETQTELVSATTDTDHSDYSDHSDIAQHRRTSMSTHDQIVKPEPRSLKEEMVKGVNAEANSKIVSMPTSNKTVLKALDQNENGDAYLLIKRLKDRSVYDYAANRWYSWDGHFWRFDEIKLYMTLIKEVINMYGDQKIYEDIAKNQAQQDGNEQKVSSHEYNSKKLGKRIEQLHTLHRQKNIFKLARYGYNSLGISGNEWDTDPMLLGCKNCVIDLKNGRRKDGQPADYIKTVSPVNWKSWETPCPAWKQFLSQMFSNDQMVVNYIQRLLGYGITGLNTEHIFPIFWGSEGRNGKGTLFETLKYVLGDFAYKAPSNFLIEQGMKSNSNAPDAVLAGLFGKRIVWCSETNEKDRLDVAKLKELVGGDTISARPPYGKRQIEFTPTHLLLIITNMRPKVPANDLSLWRRIHLIPLQNSFVENPDPNKPHEFQADKKLLAKLKKEASGILAWLVEGCVLWQRDGLNPPDSINAATAKYRVNEDILGYFLTECCCQGSKDFKVKPKKLYDEYKNWCSEVGHKSMAKIRFLKDMRKRFGEPIPTEGVRTFRGLGLLSTN